ncbi:UBX domain protein Ubx2 [Coniosporium apollinis]|uniref:UBX domain protein Ubx2 n=2 Tax=Coniosporium TaxID=2810619 RepID=A0ABQ9P527_9PEZI|nr:UBX domain protein Ubx2 [Cladosporium sp. JES 115]KAJ9668725.1 UBX domain protein Ubx2 [Coniosporium apollinis]
MDDLIADFTAITSADPERAAQYLHLTDNNLEQAIQLFFDSPNLDLSASAATQAPPASAPQPPPPARSQYAEDDDGVIRIDSDDEDSEFFGNQAQAPPRPAPAAAARPTFSSTAEDDEAMARRLQEEMYGGADQAADFGVRAPMARTTETLIGPSANWGSNSDDMSAAIAEQMRARERRVLGRPGIFNQRPPPSVWDEDNNENARRQALSRATGGASDASAKSNHLAELFRPPFDLISRLSWDEARDEGKETEKWILVDVQDAAVFDCQRLNRDIWKNSQIKDTVKENFIFLQYLKDDPNGSSYINYYFHDRDSQDAYPHIAIVDPRTGEQVKVWSGPPVPQPADFLMQLHEFLDRYSLKAYARNPVATRKAPKKPDVDRMTEEEMLEMALQNSLANNGGPRSTDPDELTRKPEASSKGKADTSTAEDADVMDTEPETATNGTTAPAVAATATPFSRISSKPHTEPPNNPASTTRIQFRHSGGRQIRRFALADPVRRIYEWLKASPLEGKEGVDFELIFMGKNLIDMLDSTIEQAGLKNGTVMVEFLED